MIRRPRYIYYILVPFLFSFVFVLTFLSLRHPRITSAVGTESFDPGYIISDYQMGNYQSMTVDEIKSFLLDHDNCRDTDTWKASNGVNDPSYFHIQDGHFVCMAEEVFGAGAEYGEGVVDGRIAAQIIYDVSQEYHINPQVLIVLLEKEQGLISDSFPNKFQYRIATGYGCPDGAPCDEKYYGFVNQLSLAASPFRTVLDGGWTNFPLGEDYIQYNPDPSCGGSMVNVRNLATSALYRYTPYQPNAAALAAGYGAGIPCGAYGNRNFYLLFNDWFGDSKIEAKKPENASEESKTEPLGENTIPDAIKDTLLQKAGDVGVDLGNPTSNIEFNPRTGIYYQEYEHGFIVGTDQTGYFISMGPIREVWKASRFESGELGFPVSNIIYDAKSNSYYQKYEHGIIRLKDGTARIE